MGGTQSVSSVTIDTTQLNSTVFEFVKKMSTKSSAAVVSSQSINANNIRAYGCQLNLENKADISIVQIQQFTEESSTQLQQSITTQLENQADTSSSASSELGSQGADSTAITNTKTLISNSVKQAITVDTLNEMVTKINATQTSNVSDIVFDPCGFTMFTQVGQTVPEWVYDKCDVKLPCNIDNNVSIHAMTTQIVNSVTSALMDNTALSDVVNKSSASSTAKSSGLASLIGAMSGLAVVVLILLALGYYIYSKNKKSGGGGGGGEAVGMPAGGGFANLTKLTPQGQLANAVLQSQYPGARGTY